MFEGLFQPTHLLIIGVVALLVFGPKKLPELGKGLGEGIREFKKSMREASENFNEASKGTTPPGTAPGAPAAPEKKEGELVQK